ncbi:Transposase, MuDR, plant [Corchorus olitorius]|uniref:Transposase, MuDR, plant n=1 Tax=Corchorus olitorius TaxID=93759 RepID=A0A1R3FY44_9ROSI|nr:Transposase, MuDR, plant [Corchorus olitorius]
MESAETEKDAANDDYDYLNWFPHIVPNIVEEPPPMELVYHHGGWFIAEPKLSYNGEMEDIEKLQYCDNDDALETDLKELDGDKDVQFLSVVLLEKKSVDIYVLHPNNDECLKNHGGAENEEVEERAGNGVDVSTSSEESGDENGEGEDEVDEELNPRVVIWDNDDNNDELLTLRVKTSKAIEDEDRLRKEIDELDLDAVIEDILGLKNPRPIRRRGKTTANRGFLELPKARKRKKAKEVYMDSDDPGSFSDTGSDSDFDNARRLPSSKLQFRPDALIELYKEQIFDGKEQFKKALNEYSLKKCFAYNFKKNDKVRVWAVCAAPGCERLEDDIIKLPLKAIHIATLVKKKLRVFIDLHKARAKLFVVRKQQMQYTEEFKRLREYADELVKQNPGTTGMLRAIGDGMPFVEQRRCARHIYARWAIFYCGKEPKDYLDVCFKKEEFLKAYVSLLHPCRGPRFWTKRNANDNLPPPMRKPKGRDKKERNKKALEGKKHSANMSRIGRKMTCSVCKSQEHNKATCPKNFQKKSKQFESSNQQSTRQQSAKTFFVPPRHVQVVNPSKESEYVIARLAGNLQNFTTVRKLKEDARKRINDRAAGISNVREVPTQERMNP